VGWIELYGMQDMHWVGMMCPASVELYSSKLLTFIASDRKCGYKNRHTHALFPALVPGLFSAVVSTPHASL
jgi:hypothetical protein